MIYAWKNKLSIPDYPCTDHYLTILDQQYPDSFRCLQYPPIVLFYKGNLSLLKKKAISVIGSRYPDKYGNDMTRLLVQRLKHKYVIVSGLAKGIDALAHESALHGGYTIGVLGCGIGEIYPRCNEYLYRQMEINHLLLSEYPSHTKPDAWHFPFRNRLIAALGDTCVVMAATLRSGTMLTVNEALSLNKNIVCLPYPLGVSAGEGCNQCIQEGAMILTNINDLDMI